jgi:TolA-binding protein
VLGVGAASFHRARVGTVERVELDDGTIDLHVRPLLAEERFLVATGDAEVEVRGTAFRVEARQRRLASVAVSEGKVEVRYAGATMLLRAGESWSLAQDAPAAAAETEGSRASSASAKGARSRDDAASGTPGVAKSARGAGASSKAFAEGMRMIERGDYAAGADKLDAYRRANPQDARAEDAAYIAVIALQRAGRKDDAAAAAKRYLRDFPNGYRRAEVQAIALKSPGGV